MVNTLRVGVWEPYTTIQAAVDALPGSSWTEPQIIEIEAGTYDETVDVSRAGAVSSSVNYLTIRPKAGEWVPGHVNGTQTWAKVEPTSGGAGSGHCFDLGIEYTRVCGLEVTRASGAATSDEGFRISANHCRIESNVIHGLTHTEADAIYLEDSYTAYIACNTIYDITRAGFDLYCGGGVVTATVRLTNNTIVDCDKGVYARDVTAASDNVSIVCNNNIVALCTTAWDIDADASTSGSRNLSDEDPPGLLDDGLPVCVVGDAAATPTGDRWIVFEETAGSVDYRLAKDRQAACKHGAHQAFQPDVDGAGNTWVSDYWVDCGAVQHSDASSFDTSISTGLFTTTDGIIEFACPTGRGEPVAALIIVSNATAENSDVAGAHMSAAFAAYGKQAGSCSFESTDNQNPTRAYMTISDTTEENVYTGIGGGSENANVQFLHFTHDGIVLDMVNAPNSKRQVMIHWFYGSDLRVELVKKSASATLNGTVTLDTGWEASALLAITCDNATAAPADDAHFSIGAAFDNGSTIEQGNVGFWQEENRGISVATTVWSDDHILSGHRDTSPNESIEVTSMDSEGEGPELTTRDEASSLTAWYMALGLPAGIDMAVFNYTAPTSTGTTATTGAGFHPGSGLIFMVDNALAKDTVWPTSGGAVGIIGLYDDTAAHSMIVWDDTLANPTNTGSRADTEILFDDEAGTAILDGTLDSFDSDGFTIDATTAAEAVEGIAVLFQRAKVELEAGGTMGFTGSASMGNHQELEAAGSMGFTGSATLSKNCEMEAAGTMAFSGTASMAGPQEMAAAGTMSMTGSATLTKNAEMLAAGTMSMAGSATLTVASVVELAAAGTLDFDGAATFAGWQELAAAGTMGFVGTADLGGPQSLAAAGAMSFAGTADLTAENTYQAAGTMSFVGTADLDAYQGLYAAGTMAFVGAADLLTGALSAAGATLKGWGLAAAGMEAEQLASARTAAENLTKAGMAAESLETP